MAIQYFIPDVWAAGILGTLSQSAVYSGAPCTNRNYEGEITAGGDTVHITSISNVTIGDYTKNTNLSDPENLTDAEQLLVIDQSKSFNFQVDDIDKAQVRNSGGLMTEATQSAGWGLRDVADKYVATKMALAATGGVLGVVDATTATNVYDLLVVPAGVKLDQANVPEEQRWLVIDPATYGKLKLDARFVNANQSGTAALHNGQVGEAGGFRIFKSNNAPQANRAILAITTVTGAKSLTGVAGQFNQGDVGLSIAGTGIGAASVVASVNADGSVAQSSVNSTAAAAVTVTLSGGGQLAIAGSQIATSFAEQILEVKAYSPEKRFGDALKGLHVYGSKVVRPTGLVVASVKVA